MSSRPNFFAKVVVGAVHVRALARRGQNHDRDPGQEPASVALPFQHLVPGPSRQLQVQQHDAGQRMPYPVGILAFPGEIGDRGIAVADHMQRIGEASLREGTADQHLVVRIVLDEEDRESVT